MPTSPTLGLASRGLHRCVSRRGWPEFSAHGSPSGAPHVGQQTDCTFGCVVFIFLLWSLSGKNKGQSGPTPERKRGRTYLPLGRSPAPLPMSGYSGRRKSTPRRAHDATPPKGQAVGAVKSPLPLFWTRAFVLGGGLSGLPCVLQIHGMCNTASGCAGRAKDILLSVCHHLRVAHCSRGTETVDIAAKIWCPVRWRSFNTVGY